jgi:carbon-monoxide dehydrogenase large subunit
MSRVLTQRWVGRSLPRVEDERFLRGTARYVGDLTLPGMLHAVFVRSAHAHGLVRELDTAAARTASGVRAVITGADLAGATDPFPVVSRDGAELVPVTHPVLARAHLAARRRPAAIAIHDYRDVNAARSFRAHDVLFVG